ncbi:hypothetical protein MG293_000589 [Ovis ammon polii]|uniref:Uncharacterized protein n=1 Tax=Ovis ammon polii TaxID=230172 RepID=A0AAD4YH86_OVIAM|nr:hypothetical protein MG293_000589 [Ovis ammon polii]
MRKILEMLKEQLTEAKDAEMSYAIDGLSSSHPNKRDGSPPGFSVPGILQARTLEWVAIFFSNACRYFSSVQFSRSVVSDPMNHSTSGLPVHHRLPEFTQIHVHRVSDAIQPS